MSDTMIAQDEVEVKQEQECEVEWCDEPVFREGLCWEHFCEEKIAEWGEEPSDHLLDTSWYGYKPEEVLA